MHNNFFHNNFLYQVYLKLTASNIYRVLKWIIMDQNINMWRFIVKGIQQQQLVAAPSLQYGAIWNHAPVVQTLHMPHSTPVTRYDSLKRVLSRRHSQTEFRCLWSGSGKERVGIRVGFQSRRPAPELIKTVNHHHPTTTPHFPHPLLSLSPVPF
jgi:hypothetical protein